MSIQSEIDRINQAKTDLAAAIESKGVTVPPNTTINVYPGLVQQIQQDNLPTGGTPGQMLYQGESGAEWGDKPVMYVHITVDSSSLTGYVADKTGQEIYQAYQNGYSVFAAVTDESDVIIPLYTAVEIEQGRYGAAFQAFFNLKTLNIQVMSINGTNQVTVSSGNIGATNISFTPGTTGLTSDNVQDAIEEVRENSLKAKDGVLGETVYIPPYDSTHRLVLLKNTAEDDVAIEWYPGDTDYPELERVLNFSPSELVKIRGIGDPVKNSDVATKGYVDGIKPKSISITLPASGWSSNTQTVTVNGVLADESAQLIQPMPAIASQSAYISAGIICSGQAANSLTFTCQTVPTENLTVYVVIQEVSA